MDKDKSMGIKLAFVNEQDEKMTERQKLIKKMHDDLPFMIQVMGHQARMTKAKYDALIKEGFTKSEAFELCKKLF